MRQCKALAASLAYHGLGAVVGLVFAPLLLLALVASTALLFFVCVGAPALVASLELGRLLATFDLDIANACGAAAANEAPAARAPLRRGSGSAAAGEPLLNATTTTATTTPRWRAVLGSASAWEDALFLAVCRLPLGVLSAAALAGFVFVALAAVTPLAALVLEAGRAGRRLYACAGSPPALELAAAPPKCAGWLVRGAGGWLGWCALACVALLAWAHGAQALASAQIRITKACLGESAAPPPRRPAARRLPFDEVA